MWFPCSPPPCPPGAPSAAQVCHRGHKLGPMEVGDLSCGCGGKKLQCVGRQHQPPAPPLSLDREEAQTPGGGLQR